MSDNDRMTNHSLQKKKANTIVSYATRVIIACLLMMWGVVNLVSNILLLRRPTEVELDWKVAGFFVLVTSLIPFAIGLTMLKKTMDSTVARKVDNASN